MNTKEKTTLRQVPQGVIATVDERPKMLQLYYNTINGGYFTQSYFVKKGYHLIAASSFGVGKELSVQYSGWFGEDIMEFDDFIKIWIYKNNSKFIFGKPYDYTETANQVIIKL